MRFAQSLCRHEYFVHAPPTFRRSLIFLRLPPPAYLLFIYFDRVYNPKASK